jgi:hypothetical protein
MTACLVHWTPVSLGTLWSWFLDSTKPMVCPPSLTTSPSGVRSPGRAHMLTFVGTWLRYSVHLTVSLYTQLEPLCQAIFLVVLNKVPFFSKTLILFDPKVPQEITIILNAMLFCGKYICHLVDTNYSYSSYSSYPCAHLSSSWQLTHTHT